MHSWLADAHSQAPAPVSALMSGVLLAVAFYALLRFKAIADAALGPAFPRALFIVVGLASLLVAASLLIAQRDVKRMLAYSSVEHMGLLALGAAAGSPLAIAAVLLHMLGHGLTKSTLFISSGEIAHAEGTTEIAKLEDAACAASGARRNLRLRVARAARLSSLQSFHQRVHDGSRRGQRGTVVGCRCLTDLPFGDLRLDHQPRAPPSARQ